MAEFLNFSNIDMLSYIILLRIAVLGIKDFQQHPWLLLI